MRAVRRVTRIVFNSLAAISLGLALLVAGLWVRSGLLDRSDGITLTHGSADNVEYKLFTSGRRLLARRIENWPLIAPAPWRIEVTATRGTISQADGSDFDYFATNRSYGVEQLWALSTPLWMWQALTLVLPITVGVRRLRQTDHPKETRCLTCGYDLRASPDRCPECGSIANAIS